MSQHDTTDAPIVITSDARNATRWAEEEDARGTENLSYLIDPSGPTAAAAGSTARGRWQTRVAVLTAGAIIFCIVGELTFLAFNAGNNICAGMKSVFKSNASAKLWELFERNI